MNNYQNLAIAKYYLKTQPCAASMALHKSFNEPKRLSLTCKTDPGIIDAFYVRDAADRFIEH